MLTGFRNLSIRKKITALMMLISVLILVLTGSLYLAEEVYSSRIFLQRQMMSLGATLGISSRNLLMAQQVDKAQELLASLKVQPNIRAAYLFDEQGLPVAQYLDPTASQFVLKVAALDFSASEAKPWIDLSEPKRTTSWRHFGLFLPIMHDGQQVGSLYMLSDLHDLYARLNGVVFVVLSLLGGVLVMSWWLAGKLQRPVSTPLLSLVETMAAITQSQDFSVRASKQGTDEIGQLVDGFNRMLEQIETHRRQLVTHQQTLEQTVDRRTGELREIVEILKQAKLQAEAASEAKSQFLSNITHELRTPLIGVLGMNELLFRTAMDEQQTMLAGTVQKSGEDLLLLINNVLDFSKIEAGKMQLEKAEFALYRTLDDVLALLAGAAAEKGLTLMAEVPLAATCRVLGDELRVRQIMMNLIGNAIKFTEQGTVTVRLDCTCLPDGEVSFVLQVIDTGIGMDEAAQQQIFSAFYQADAAHTRKYSGTGLGLAIVQQLVKLLAGELQLESSVDAGSCFKVSFTLPAVAATPMQLPETLRRQPVLVHAEDAVCQQLLTRLAELGLKPVVATSVADFWYQLTSAQRNGTPFSIAIFPADERLPDGQLLSLAIRQDRDLRSLRRIILQSRSQLSTLQKQEHKLFLPIGWSDLFETLCQSWHELHLVDDVLEHHPTSTIAAQPVLEVPLLVAGGSVAGRELIKLSLGDLPVAVDCASDIDQVQASVDNITYTAVLLDTAIAPLAQLEDYCRQAGAGPALFLLCWPTDDIAALRPFVTGVIDKPFCREQFQSHLQAVFAATVVNQNAATDTSEGGV